MIRVQLAEGEVGERAVMGVALVAGGDTMERSEGMVAWTYATHAENDREVGGYAESAMSPMMLKSSLFAAEPEGKGRDHQGKARRRP